jgi:cytidylate kinase
MSDRKTVVAIDGPVASGKGTLSRLLAAYFDFRHLDTGSLYRAAALNLLRRGDEPGDTAAAVRAAETVANIDLTDIALRDEKIGLLASQIAPIPEVRKTLLDYQRQFAKDPPDQGRGAVLEGRDITTIVCPDADVKIFVTATAEVRAERRYNELKDRGEIVTYEEVLADLLRRDRQDSERAASPLKLADDAHLLDTSILDIDTAFEAACEIIRAAARN